VVRLSSSSANKMQVEDVSDTLYVRASLLSDATRKPGPSAPALTVSPAIAELIRGKLDRAPRPPRQAPCWSDCDCKQCHSWSTGARSSHLYVHVQSPLPLAESSATEAVVFIHGFISSSVFWTETVFPAFSPGARSKYRMFAVDLLGFGRSPKPAESLYTLREHLEMIERSVLQRYRLTSFHVVAHSLGSVLALALAVKYPDAVKSLTLLAPVRARSLGSAVPTTIWTVHAFPMHLIAEPHPISGRSPLSINGVALLGHLACADHHVVTV
jgi:pimeloyl-ACP methyl ester carboxylesterase